MDYYDGNTVTALWTYAQHYAMSDNSFSPTFGPSSPGAVNLVSGNTGGIDTAHEANAPSIATSEKPNADITPDGSGGYSLTSDAQPYWDDCSTRNAVGLTGKNIGDLLNAAGVSWGWFEGGFKPTTDFAAAATAVGHSGQSTATFLPDEFKGKFFVAPAGDQGICNAVTPVGVALGETAATHQFGFKDDYIPHHEPFQYYASTANPHHLPPSSLSSIGTDTQHYVSGVPQFDTANHNYDLSDFDQLVAAISGGQLPASALPAVTFLKAPGYQDGHAAYSDPADEQAFIVREVNALMQTPAWSSTAVIVNYDDSDGWYDHVYSGVTNPSLSVADNLTNSVLKPNTGTSGQCGPKPQTSAPLGGQQGRCGFGPRQPELLISPCARQNYVDHNLSDLASIPNFIEYNWGLPAIPGSFDQSLTNTTDKAAGIPFDLAGMFDFKHCSNPSLLLDPATGQIDLTKANLQGKNLQGMNLSGAEASGSNLQGSNLRNAFLPNADLHGSNLQGVNLSNSDLHGDNLQAAILQGANLQRDDLTGVNLSGAILQGTNMQGDDLTNSNLTGAKLQGANVNKVIWSNTTCPDGTNSNTHGSTCVGHI
jgi:phospholipase C